MTTTRIKEKLSTLVASQLPEFIRSEYPTFVAFLEAYYKFLEQDQSAHELIQNARLYNDIDTTIDSFVSYFLKTYCADIPETVLSDKKLLLKNIKDLYENKGDEKSYNLLFQLLFGKKPEFFYPGEYILKASDGKWIQKTSIFIQPIVGNPDLIVGKEIKVVTNNIEYPIYIESRRAASTLFGVSSSIFEYFFDNSKNVPIQADSVIEFGNFKGLVVTVPITVEIINPGVGFSIGDILPLTSSDGVSGRLKVTSVNSTGGITQLQFVSFGPGYNNDFYNSYSALLSTIPTTTFNFSGNEATIGDKTGGFIERGTIISKDYDVVASPYFGEDYVGILLGSFFTSTVQVSTNLNQQLFSVTAGTGLPTDATILVRLGTKAKYPGYFENADGFLSDVVFLEDRDYYNPFTYALKIDERLSSYKQAVLDLVHPAGTKLYGDLTFTIDVDTETTVLNTVRVLNNFFQDQIGLIDSNSYVFTKPLSNTISTVDVANATIQKALTEALQILDDSSSNLTKALNDDTGNEDSLTKSIQVVFNGTGPYASGDYFLEDYIEDFTAEAGSDFFNIEDTPNINVTVGLTETQIVVESANVTITLGLTDTVTIEEELSYILS